MVYARNAVADVLGIDRGRAHVLAGIVASAARQAEPEPEWLRDLRALIYDELPPDRAAKVEAAVEAARFEDEGEPRRRRAAGG